jgi:hypothetical protein
MRCDHDFRLMVSELLCVRQGKIGLRNLTLDTFNPLKEKQIHAHHSNHGGIQVENHLFNHNSSKLLNNLPVNVPSEMPLILN